MITLTDVHKRYHTQRRSHWVLKGVNLSIPPRCNVALIGANGAGKSTLLRLIGGIDTPDRGEIARDSRLSWPLGLSGGFQGSLSGRQNAKFVCRIHGHEDDIRDRLRFIHEFSELGNAFDDPIKTYSTGMRARLGFALSLAFDFDVYLVDEVTAVGDTSFRIKTRKAFHDLIDRAGLIMVSHDPKTLNQFCQAGVWLHDGQAHWFDSVNEALRAYGQTVKKYK